MCSHTLIKSTRQTLHGEGGQERRKGEGLAEVKIELNPGGCLDTSESEKLRKQDICMGRGLVTEVRLREAGEIAMVKTLRVMSGELGSLSDGSNVEEPFVYWTLWCPVCVRVKNLDSGVPV